MKKTILPLILIILATNLYGQNITIDEHGIVKCAGMAIGTTEVVEGDTYEVVDRNLLIQRRNEDADLTKVCVSNVTDMSEMFLGKQFNQSIGNWDVGNVTNMSLMFAGTPFNQLIGDWYVSNVTNMESMFSQSEFNQPIGNWDVSSVINMDGMFNGSQFDQPIGNWDVSNVTNMGAMFGNSPFNQPIGDWDVSNVIRMGPMFSFSPFNQSIGNWNVSNVTDMTGMFWESQFDQIIGNWDVSNVTNLSFMFRNSPFNQPIGDWDVSNVENMISMFRGSSFNQSIGDWNVGNVRFMDYMFEFSQFNQPIGDWDVSNVILMRSMFESSQFDKPIGNWNVSNVIDMSWMFRLSNYDQPIGNWDVRNVTNMGSMFRGSTFNQPIGDWEVRNVTNMGAMFMDSQFNQPLNEWCVIKVTQEPANFSTNSPITPENKPNWGTCIGLPSQLLQLAPDNNSTNVSRTPKLSWKPDSVSTRFQLQLFVGINQAVVDTLIADTLYANINPLNSNFEYSWRVRGINENFTNRVGEWSELWSFTTQMDPAGIIALLSPFNGSIVDELTPTLTWITDPNSESYIVQVSSDEFDSIVFEEVVSDTTITTPTLSFSTEYQWRVRGSNSSGEGEWSYIWSFNTGVDTSIDTDEVPSQFALQQNYPNPFNPTTQIQFSLPVSTTVRLDVFSVLGQRTVTLLNEHMPVGIHTVPFDARSLSSGVYIYRLTTPEFTQSRLMNLIK